MGNNNRQRRQEKQRRRDARRADGACRPGGFGHSRDRVDDFPTAYLIGAAAMALANGDEISGHDLMALATTRPDARRYAAEALLEALEALGPAGWEPRLAANLVRRRLTARHAKLVTEGLDGPDDVAPAIEVMGVLFGFPVLVPLPRSVEIDEAQAKVLAKVRGLLAKAESTTFPAEAEALSAKAQELMARHAIDHALASAQAKPEDPGGRRVPLEDPYADAKASLLGAVARANRCKAVHVVSLAHCTVLGFESDLVAVELLFTSLLVQANRAMLAAGKADQRARQRGFRSSFLAAYANRIGQRLEESTAAEVAEADAEMAGRLLPVLAARTEAVEDAVDAMFGDSLTSRRTRISDHRGWVAGHAAANLANLAAGPEVRAAG